MNWFYSVITRRIFALGSLVMILFSALWIGLSTHIPPAQPPTNYKDLLFILWLLVAAASKVLICLCADLDKDISKKIVNPISFVFSCLAIFISLVFLSMVGKIDGFASLMLTKNIPFDIFLASMCLADAYNLSYFVFKKETA